jgi:DNA-binding transcriptional ArsR family regulator
MRERSSESPVGGDRKLERAIILHLLDEESARRCSRAHLASALGAPAPTLQPALQRLSDAGVVCLEGNEVWASPAARHIDALGLIGI